MPVGGIGAALRRSLSEHANASESTADAMRGAAVYAGAGAQRYEDEDMHMEEASVKQEETGTEAVNDLVSVPTKGTCERQTPMGFESIDDM